jgi:hypothetical protein
MGMSRIIFLGKFVSIGIAMGCFAFAQQKPLTNDDVITMVKDGMPESVVVSAIQSRQGKFSTSTSELVRLHKAGVTENELNAMIATSSKGNPTPSSNLEPPASAPPRSHMPRVSLTVGGAARDLPLEKTQLAETKTKPSSLKLLAGDSAVTQAMQAGINTASYSAASHIGSAIGSTSVQQAGGVLSSIMSHRQPKMTYVWGVPGPASSTVLQIASPAFSVDFSRALGVQPDDYEPTIVKLTPAQNTCRILGATEGKEDVRSSPASDWQVYAHFLEERVNTQSQKLGPGKYNISPASELAPGEYALVLRPLNKTKKFSGGDVARAQGDGLMFDATWTFQVAEDAQ